MWRGLTTTLASLAEAFDENEAEADSLPVEQPEQTRSPALEGKPTMWRRFAGNLNGLAEATRETEFDSLHVSSVGVDCRATTDPDECLQS